MTQTPLRSKTRWALGSLAVLTLCSSSPASWAGEKRVEKKFVFAYQSPAAAPDANWHEAAFTEASISAPPTLSQPSYALPSLTNATQATLRLREIDSRLRRAEEKFDAGKRALAEGNQELARRLFNESIDLVLEAPSDVASASRDRINRRAQELIDAIYRYDVSRLGASEAPEQFIFEGSPRERVLEELTFPPDARLRSRVSDQVGGTISQLPLEVNDSVLSYIKFFTERGRPTLLAGLRRSGRYKDMIHRVLREEGVPQELIFLAQVESQFHPRIVSWAACAGMWQFLGARGREYGLRLDGNLDERLDPEKATRAAARHLRDLYKQFGDWYLAMGAYNCGPGCIDGAVRRTGYADFWKLREMNVIPRETANYVPAIVALTIISKNAQDYGVANLVLDPAIEHDTIEVAEATNLELVASALDRPIEEVRDLNPSLVKPVAPKGYALHVPRGTMRIVATALETIPAKNRATWRFHRVRNGDTAAAIAAKYYVTPASLTAANTGLEVAEPGDLIAVPPAAYAPRNNRWAAPRYNAYAARRTAYYNSTKSKATAPVQTIRGKGPAVVAKPVILPGRSVAQAPAKKPVPVTPRRGA